MSDTLKKIAENYGAGLVNGSYLNGIAEAIGVDLATSTDLMADILTASGGYPENSTDYLQDIVLALGGSEPVNGNWMEAWEAITAVPPVAPVNTYPPALSYVFRYEGEPVDTSDGTWDNSPTSFTYQWYRDATPISGETLSQYILTSADVDTEITCQVTAINAGGSSTPEPSDAAYIFDYDYGQVYYYIGYDYTADPESILQNQFMLAIKAAGVWDKLDVLCVFRGSSNLSSLVDWKRLIQIVNNECTFDTTQGYTGSSNIYIAASISTNFVTNSGTNYTQDNASRYFFPYAFSGPGPMDGNDYNVMNLGGTTINKINSQTDLDSAFQYTTTVEPKSIHRTSDTDVTLFNGTTSASRTNTSESGGNYLSILAQDGSWGAHTVAAYAAGASMVSENTDFVAAWNTYITAL
jgi:hypothetical protein